MTERVSQAEAARRFGVARQSINEMVARGVLPLIDGKIDMDVAEAIVRKRLDPARSKALQNLESHAPAPPVGGMSQAPADSTPAASGEITSYHMARTLREKYAALDAKVRYEMLCGTLVEASRVRQVITTAAATLRLSIDAVPDRLSDRLAAETDPVACHALLRKALDDALAAFDDADIALLTAAEAAA